MRKGPTGLRGTFFAQSMGNVGALRRDWDRALHLYRGEVIPWDANFVILHEPTGTGNITIDHDVTIVGMPGSRLEWNLVIEGNAVVEIRNIYLTGTITVQGNAFLSIHDCVIATIGIAVEIENSHNIVSNLTAAAGISVTGPMVWLTSSSTDNRVIGCDSTGYSDGIKDDGTGNILVGNL